MELLASWHYGEVAPEVLIEEIHAAAELLLMASVNRRAKSLSFAQEEAHSQRLLRSYPDFDKPAVLDAISALPRTDPEALPSLLNDMGRTVLLSLKDCRKRVRHRGATGAKEWLDANFWEAVAVLEHLAPHARDRGAVLT